MKPGDDGPFGDPRFTIPTDAADGTTLVFQLTVTDQEGQSDSDTVTVTVDASDDEPDPLRFFPKPELYNTPPGGGFLVTADVTGSNVPVPISVSAPAAANVTVHITDEGFGRVTGWLSPAEFNNRSITVKNRDIVWLTANASNTPGETFTITVTLGERATDWSLTTLDQEPDDFSLAPVVDAVPGAAVESEAITISGLNWSTKASVSPPGAQLIISGRWGHANTIENGYVVKLRTTASTAPGQTRTFTLHVGTYQTDWRVTTAGQDSHRDRSPSLRLPMRIPAPWSPATPPPSAGLTLPRRFPSGRRPRPTSGPCSTALPRPTWPW